MNIRFIRFLIIIFLVFSTTLPIFAADNCISNFVRLTDSLNYFLYLKDHPFYGLNPDNLKIYYQLKLKSDSNFESFAKTVLNDQSGLNRFSEYMTKLNEETFLPLIDELKRRALAQNLKNAYETLSEMNALLTREAQSEKSFVNSSFLSYMRKLSPTTIEINNIVANGVVQADVVTLINSKGPFLGDIYNVLGDVMAHMKQYKTAVAFKEKAIKELKPTTINDYLYLSEIEKDIALYNYILCGQADGTLTKTKASAASIVKSEANVTEYFDQALIYIAKSIISIEKANGTDVLLNYRRLFQLRFLYEARRFDEAITLLEKVMSANSFKEDFAIIGILLITSLPDASSPEKMSKLDSFAQILNDSLTNNISFDRLGGHIAMARYNALKGDWQQFLEHQSKAIELYKTIKPASDIERRQIQSYSKEIKLGADYGGADSTLSGEISKLMKSGQFIPAIAKCHEFTVKYPDSADMFTVLFSYNNAILYGVVLDTFSKYYHIPFWEKSSSAYQQYLKVFEKYESEVEYYKSIILKHSDLPSYSQCWYSIGQFYTYKYDYAKSNDAFSTILKNTDISSNYLKPAAIAWIAENNAYMAEQETNPDNRKEVYKKAIALKQQLLASYPQLYSVAVAYYAMSFDYIAIADYDNALKAIEKYLSSTNQSKDLFLPMGYCVKGQIYEKLAELTNDSQKITLAKAAYEQAIAYKYKTNQHKIGFLPSAYLGQASCIIKLATSTANGNFDNATVILDKIIDGSLFPAPEKGYENYSLMYLKYFKAAAQLKKGEILMFQGKYQEAINQFKLASNQYQTETAFKTSNVSYPFDPNYFVNPPSDYEPKPPKPYNISVRFVNRFEDDSLYFQAKAYEKLGNTEEAMKLYQQIIDQFSNQQLRQTNNLPFPKVRGIESILDMFAPYYWDKVKDAQTALNAKVTLEFEGTPLKKVYAYYDNNPYEITLNIHTQSQNIPKDLSIEFTFVDSFSHYNEANPDPNKKFIKNNNFLFLRNNQDGSDTKNFGFQSTDGLKDSLVISNISSNKVKVNFKFTKFGGDLFTIKAKVLSPYSGESSTQLQVWKRSTLKLFAMVNKGNSKNLYPKINFAVDSFNECFIELVKEDNFTNDVEIPFHEKIMALKPDDVPAGKIGITGFVKELETLFPEKIKFELQNKYVNVIGCYEVNVLPNFPNDPFTVLRGYYRRAFTDQFGSEYKDKFFNSVLMSYNELRDQEGKTLSHELGHAFGLLHPKNDPETPGETKYEHQSYCLMYTGGSNPNGKFCENCKILIKNNFINIGGTEFKAHRAGDINEKK